MSTHRTHSGSVDESESLDSGFFDSRATFGLLRQREAGEPTLRLYELLPETQARTRRQRLERVGESLSISDCDDAFSLSEQDLTDEWMEEWVAVKIANLRGSRLKSVLSIIRESLGEAEIDHKPITTTEGGEVFVPEDIGVKLALAFVGVEEIRRVDRMRGLVRGVSEMSTEECYYWYAKCRSPNSPNGVKALRVLLTNHIS